MTKTQKRNASREPVAFVYDCSKCSKLVVVKVDVPFQCPKCGSKDGVFVGNRYAKKAKAAKAPRQLETRALLAGAYVGYHNQEKNFLTHTLDVVADKFICRGPKPENACDAGGSDVNARPTCERCAAKDPRFS